MITTQLFHYLVDHFHIAFFLLAVIGFLIILLFHSGRTTKSWCIEIMTQCYCVCFIGLSSLYQSYQLLINNEQWQLGLIYLGIGSLGILAFQNNISIRATLMIIFSMCYIGEQTEIFFQRSTSDWMDWITYLWHCFMPIKIGLTLLLHSEQSLNLFNNVQRSDVSQNFNETKI